MIINSKTVSLTKAAMYLNCTRKKCRRNYKSYSPLHIKILPSAKFFNRSLNDKKVYPT